MLTGLIMSSANAQIFAANEKHIVNHDIMHCTAEGVVGNHLYSGRALGITESYDIIQLSDQLKPLFEYISRHYMRVGLSHTRDVIWNVEMDQLGKYIGFYPSVFFFGAQQYFSWGDNEWLSIVDYINSKNNFIELANQIGIKVPMTLAFDSVDKIDNATIVKATYPCYLKAAVSVSGVGIYRCENPQELRKAIASFDTQVPVQIQEEVQAKTFLNMQYKIEYGFALRLACTEQILDSFEHQENTYPACYEPWEVVDPMAAWMAERGMKGVFAFDVAVIEKPDGVTYFAIECNPRYNGATYSALIAQKLSIKQWVAKTYSTRYRDLNDIPIDHIEYSKKSGYGVIIVNWGTILEGKLIILLAGNSEQQQYLDAELISCL